MRRRQTFDFTVLDPQQNTWEGGRYGGKSVKREENIRTEKEKREGGRRGREEKEKGEGERRKEKEGEEEDRQSGR